MPSDLYGLTASGIDTVAERLGRVLGIHFEPRDSDFWGPYDLFESGGGEVRIYFNDDPMHDPGSDPPEEQFFEPDHSKYGVLVSAELLDEIWLHCLRGVIRSEFPDSVLIRSRDD